jgi:hypothetical protein
LDNGAFGSISRATFRDKVVVLKRIEDSEGMNNSRECIDVILSELIAVSKLKHPNIVNFEGMVLQFPMHNLKQHQLDAAFVFEFCELGNVFNNVFGAARTLGLWQDRLRICYEV